MQTVAENRKRPKVSIGMPVYNGGKFIREALNSLIGQTFKDFELIISDNASTDKTETICRDYEKMDSRVKYYKNVANMGGAWNFNRVLELSTGDFFMWASCDDYWDLKYIESCLYNFEMSSDIVLSGTECVSFSDETRKVQLLDKGFSTLGLSPEQRFKKYKTIIHSGQHVGGIFHGLYKRKELLKIMPLKKIIAADHLTLAQLSLNGHFFTASKVLFFKRWGGGSASLKKVSKTVGIRNDLFRLFPYLIREYFFQKIIFSSNTLNRLEKYRLSLWSCANYLVVNVVKGTILDFKILIKRILIKFNYNF